MTPHLSFSSMTYASPIFCNKLVSRFCPGFIAAQASLREDLHRGQTCKLL